MTLPRRSYSEQVGYSKVRVRHHLTVNRLLLLVSYSNLLNLGSSTMETLQ